MAERKTMPVLPEADGLLLKRIRQADTDAWSQLVQRHQGRLIAFAAARLSQSAEAEDLVQDTFIAFLQSLDRFRGDASIETYLFTILRRKIIDRFRLARPELTSLDRLTMNRLRDAAPTASSHARLREDADRLREALLDTLRSLIEDYKNSMRLEDLKVIEMVFACGRRNKDIARTLGLSAERVAVIRHRTIARLREGMAARFTADDRSDRLPDLGDDTLRTLWREYRISCPKRSTIGGYLLDSLDDQWRQYVRFHLETADCPFCQANLADLQRQTDAADQTAFRARVLNSTVGFLHRGNRGAGANR